MKSHTRHITSVTSESRVSDSFRQVLKDYALLVKLNLTLIVVLTALGAFIIASSLTMNWVDLCMLGFGGFFITAASNILNQVLERDFDKLMKRTQNRPLVTNKISVSNAVLIAGLLCLAGVTMLSYFNPLCAFLGMMSFVLYAFIYTPLKRYSSVAVFVGAISGAMPMTIGVVAFSGELTMLAIGLFMVQFFWQYPHFWSIAFKGFKDYRNAGYNFIPFENEETPSRQIGVSSVIMSICLLPSIALLYFAGVQSMLVLGTLFVFSLAFIWLSIQFYRKFDAKSSLHLLLGSFAYIPGVLFIIIIGML